MKDRHPKLTDADIKKIAYQIINDDVKEGIRKISSGKTKINCVVTSPPYWQKKRYGDSDRELGQETSVGHYVNELVSIFNSIPLHPLGSVWVNIGDKRGKAGENLLIPERFAIAMQDSGWLLVDKVIWAKSVVYPDGTTSGNCMTEPANNRLNGNGHEYIFRFVHTKKASNAWSDTCSVAIPRQEAKQSNLRYLPEELMGCNSIVDGRNCHNVWQLRQGQTKKKHYAVFPESLCERPIAMTCPMFVSGDKILSRIVEMQEYDEGRGAKRTFGKYASSNDDEDAKEKSGRGDERRDYIARKPVTVGWEDSEDWRPGVVLDPFCGTGTTGRVALKMGRRFIGIELYKEYYDVAEQGCKDTIDYILKNGINPFSAHH